MTSTSQFRDLNGQRFHCYHWGDPANPPLLMLHGFPEYGGAWSDLAPLLAGHFYCIAPDQRGFGRSWSPAGIPRYAASELVGDMTALIRQLDRPVTVFGHDWGAAIAYGLAMFHPDLTERLIIANGVHPVPFQRALAAGGAQSAASQYIDFLRQPGSEDILAADGFAKLLDLFSANMDLSWLTGARLANYRQAWGDATQLNRMINWYRASPLRVAKPGEPLTDLPDFPVDRLQVRCPHLLLWGDADTALRPETTQGLEAFAADLTRVTIPGADHWLLHQKPEQVAQAVLTWVNT
ncbi:alpha/beta hydrolase [Rhodobacteraceae bacterium M382]|nr:alpha/beta hydrolase [Rhodobacteraceae bacterium M382]